MTISVAIPVIFPLIVLKKGGCYSHASMILPTIRRRGALNPPLDIIEFKKLLIDLDILQSPLYSF